MTSAVRLKINARLFFLVKVSAARPKKKSKNTKAPTFKFF